MKKLFYRLASSQSFAKLFSLDGRLEERRRAIFSKSSVCAVVALAACMSLGALLFPHVGHAQCVWDCDLGSDILDNPWSNSPQFDIVYCFDQDCVKNLKDSNNNPIFTKSIPPAKVRNTLSNSSCPGTTDVTVLGDVVALLRDSQGNLQPQSAVQARLLIIIKGVTCSVLEGSSSTVLSRVLTVDPETLETEPRTNVFDGTSSITILAPTSSTPASLKTPKGWPFPCISNEGTGILAQDCPFPLGIVEFNSGTLAADLPQFGQFALGEVYRAVQSTRFIGIRDCKGDANSMDPGTITCSVGGGQSLGLIEFPGNWAGAENKKFNPKSGTGAFDIFTELFNGIDPTTVTASVNGGNPIPARKCDDKPSQNTERCFFAAKDLLPNGCIKGAPVNILVKGRVSIGGTVFKFESKDNPTCN